LLTAEEKDCLKLLFYLAFSGVQLPYVMLVCDHIAAMSEHIFSVSKLQYSSGGPLTEIIIRLETVSTRDVHGNGIPNGNGNPMGMGIKYRIGNGNGREWETTSVGMGITCTPLPWEFIPKGFMLR